MHVGDPVASTRRSLRVARAPRGRTRVVSLGDSAISGEAGRWAGNTNGSSSRTDALGADGVLRQPPDGRGDPGLPPLQVGRGAHRRRRDEREPRLLGRAHLHALRRRRVQARLDFYNVSGHKGQALALQELRGGNHNIKAVVVLIGANDYGFADIVQTACSTG